MRTFLLSICLFICSLGLAADQDHVRKIITQSILCSDNAAQIVANYYTIPEGLSFEKIRDEIDELGVRHQSYKQFFNGIEVEGYLLIIHSKEGKITAMSGSLLQQTPAKVKARISPETALRIVKKNATHQANTEIKYICVNGKIYEVYKYVSQEKNEAFYFDTESGDLLQRIPLYHNFDKAPQSGSTVTGYGYTLYNGVQPMESFCENGVYYLLDSNRGIITLSADGNPFNEEQILANMPDSLKNELEILINNGDTLEFTKRLVSYEINEYINSCILYSNDEPDWYFSTLSSVTISSANSSWWYDIWDTEPDLYIKVFNHNGECVYTSPTIQNATFPISFNIPFTLYLQSPGYVVRIYDEDATSDSYGGGVTINSAHAGTYTWQDASSTSGSLVISPQPDGLFDVHWGMQKTVDFYTDIFGRNSYDNQGALIYNLVYPPHDNSVFTTMPNNAAAMSLYESHFMIYGKGDGKYMNPVVSLDVMAHEFTHLVTNNNGNGGLVYSNESGALNESFSDIMAMGAWYNTWGTCPWTIGAGVMITQNAMRSMAFPHLYDQPEYYLNDPFWCTIPATQDSTQTFVHTNSGVQNKWFYLVSEGGSGVTGISIQNALQIAYRNLIYYLSPNANYYDARFGSEMATIDLFGANSPELAAVRQAWDIVGVFDQNTGSSLINNSNIENDTKKIMRDGHLYIIRNGHTYSAIGNVID